VFYEVKDVVTMVAIDIITIIIIIIIIIFIIIIIIDVAGSSEHIWFRRHDFFSYSSA